MQYVIAVCCHAAISLYVVFDLSKKTALKTIEPLCEQADVILFTHTPQVLLCVWGGRDGEDGDDWEKEKGREQLPLSPPWLLLFDAAQ